MDRDRIDELMDEADFVGPPEQRAQRFEALATRLSRGGYGRIDALVSAAEDHRREGRYDDAARCLALADGDDGEALLDLDAAWLELAVVREDEAAVVEIIQDLRARSRRDELALVTYQEVGEVFEEHGRLREALRWFTIPLAYVDPGDEDLPRDCLAGRFRVRRELDLPRDHFDAATAELMPRLAAQY